MISLNSLGVKFKTTDEFTAGIKRPTKTEMIETTTSNSIKLNAFLKVSPLPYKPLAEDETTLESN